MVLERAKRKQIHILRVGGEKITILILEREKNVVTYMTNLTNLDVAKNTCTKFQWAAGSFCNSNRDAAQARLRDRPPMHEQPAHAYYFTK